MSMTKEEAIKSLQNIIEYWTYKPTEVEAAKMAISALRPITRELRSEILRMPEIFGHLTNRVDLIDLPNCKQKFTNVEGVIG